LEVREETEEKDINETGKKYQAPQRTRRKKTQ